MPPKTRGHPTDTPNRGGVKKKRKGKKAKGKTARSQSSAEVITPTSQRTKEKLSPRRRAAAANPFNIEPAEVPKPPRQLFLRGGIGDIEDEKISCLSFGLRNQWEPHKKVMCHECIVFCDHCLSQTWNPATWVWRKRRNKLKCERPWHADWADHPVQLKVNRMHNFHEFFDFARDAEFKASRSNKVRESSGPITPIQVEAME
mmetsp:Transcript_935/g.1643  ORF Transcript_935/g.1643 Transcript_935/m.1643 type:complete len:202 (-) Transcript_935:522-1127(-)